MTTTTLAARLQQHPFVKDFQPSHIERLAQLAREVRYGEGEIVFKEGDERRDFFLILSGRVALEMMVPGSALRVENLSAGDELGWSAVLPGRGKHFQARTLEATEMLAFDGNELLAACKADPSFGFALMYHMLGLVRGRLQSTRLQVLDMYSPRAKKAGA
jgi:CRP-like cAMP-binding protein